MKTLILGHSRTQALNFFRTWQLNVNGFRYVMHWDDCCGHHWDTPVILLEGYEYNKNYTLKLMELIGHRFNNIAFLSEGEIYGEEVKEIHLEYSDSTGSVWQHPSIRR